MNKKGQALVEFIIVLPIFIFLILSILDFVNIYKAKTTLEDTLENIILDEDYNYDENMRLDSETKDGKITYRLSKKIDIVSPFISVVTSNKYDVIITRTVYEK